MIKLREIYQDTIDSKLMLGEALDLKTAKEYTSFERNPRMQEKIDNIFNRLSNLKNAESSKRNDRIYVPLKSNKDYDLPPDSEKLRNKMDAIFKTNDWEIVDYVDNVAKDEYGRKTKITKLLSRLQDDKYWGGTSKVWMQRYNSDPVRAAKSSINTAYLVFSKHPYDIAGQSTDRGWSSCMNLYGGSGMAKYVQRDIEEGTIIVYLIHGNDKNIESPIGRVLVKPFVKIENPDEVLYVPENTVYGTAPKSFLKQVKNIFEKLQNEKFGRFELIDRLYCDSGKGYKTQVRIPRAVQAIIDGKKEPESKDEVEYILKHHLVIQSEYDINEDLSVDVHGSIYLSRNSLKRIPIQFGIVDGDFDVSDNLLESLKGSPRECKAFACSKNKLTSLEYSPKKATSLFCYNNIELTSTKGMPKVNDVINASMCSLTELVDMPDRIEGSLNLRSNRLTTLEGSPKYVGGHLDVSGNKLESFKGAPEYVGQAIYISVNPIKSLEGIPQDVGAISTPIRYFGQFKYDDVANAIKNLRNQY